MQSVRKTGKKKKLSFFVCFFFLVLFGLTTALLFAGDTRGERQAETPVAGESIRYVSFTPTYEALETALAIDIRWREEGILPEYGWCHLLALTSARLGGDYRNFHVRDMENLALCMENGEAPETMTRNTGLYAYYVEAYTAALGGMVGSYTRVSRTVTETGSVLEERETGYGLRAFSPIAASFSYTDYDDFGTARSYGYARTHEGHDLFGSVGTPVVAIEGGYVAHLGWNRFGGWRIGIRSFDGKRYYYYAHLRAGSPYAAGLCEGDTVYAGQVIGYLGQTGYSSVENTNGIEEPHLHLGLQLIFETEQIDGNNQIWIDLQALTRLLAKNRSPAKKTGERAWESRYYYEIPETPD